MKKTFFLIALSMLLFTSCSTELKLAKQFVEQSQNIPVAVLFPEKADVKVEYSLKYEKKTEVLDNFSQDLFLDVVYNSYVEGLCSMGLDVYVPENADNIVMDSTHWYVLLSQMEIVGRITEYEDYLFSDRNDYSYKYPLNTVNVASWFEVNNGQWLPILFNETNLIDKFSSKTDYSIWSTKFDYHYNIDTLKVDDVYNFGVYLGKLYASYTYNSLINKYVETEMVKEYNLLPSVYVKYDPISKEYFYDANDERFIELDQ